MRELREETGLQACDVRLVEGFMRSERYRFTVPGRRGRTIITKQVTYFLAEALRTEIVPSAAEIMDHGWFDLPEAIRRVRYRERRRILAAAAEVAGCGEPG